MACPFFYPTSRCDRELWPHRARLPLGDGYLGRCASSSDHDPAPTDEQLKEFCNLGYARHCPQLPIHRAADALHFSMAREHDGVIALHYVLELNHAPGEHGTLEFDLARSAWRNPHPDPRVQRMAECYLEAHLARRRART